MKRIILILSILLVSISLGAAPLDGFKYGKETAPDGSEWQDPEQLSLNKEMPHAWFFSFQDKESATKVLPENSSYWKSLNGTWKFNWVGNPEERPVDFHKDGYDVSGWDDIEVPSNWNVAGLGEDGSQKYGTPIYINVNAIFKVEVKPGDWKNGVMRTPPEDWTMYRNRNEVGSYKRTFEVPSDWDGMDVFLNFDGVDSFFYLWVNGQYIGFSKNSRNTASFDITEYLRKGSNELAVEVYRNSDGSMLEVQDMFRLPGIFRTVALEAKPKAHVRDIRVTPGFSDESRRNGYLDIALDGVNLPDGCNVTYTIYENGLYSDSVSQVLVSEGNDVEKSRINVDGVKLWSAEAPYRYTVVGELKSADGKVLDIFSTNTGFRDVDIHFCKAEDDEFGLQGRYFFVNGKTIKLKGVNRHESDPCTGHVVSRELMEKDLFLMKRANINHVRNCHYPDEPYWYYLCDKYGIYLMDEANIESHEYRYGAASLSHPKEWRAAHVARMTEMVCQNYNHPSIVIWSMGNEAGPGMNFQATYDAAKAIDQSRIVQYERNNNISDIGCCQYPSVEWVEYAVKGIEEVKYPFHINEYAHSMGNSLGNFKDYWDAFESTNFFMGGAIWDWVDQGIYYHSADGTKYIAYGGDFGDKPNDGTFMMNGTILADRTPKPQYYEVKAVHQYVRSTLEGKNLTIFNKNYFEPASYDLRWTVLADGKAVQSGILAVSDVQPRESVEVSVPYASLQAGKECFLNVEYLTRADLPWAEKGYDVAHDQFMIQKPAAVAPKAAKGKLSIAGGRIKGKSFTLDYDFERGTIAALTYGKTSVIKGGNGPVYNPFRSFVDNDNWALDSWAYDGLQALEFKVSEAEIENSGNSIVITQTIDAKARCSYKIEGRMCSGRNAFVENSEPADDLLAFIIKQRCTVHADGRVVFEYDIDSSDGKYALPRNGFQLALDKNLNRFRYYGRGPEENYNDRCYGALVGIYSSTVAEQYTMYARPQEMANHEAVRWVELTDSKGKGIRVSALSNSCYEDAVFSASALPYDSMDLFSTPHPYELPEVQYTYLNVDAKVTGLGGNSCGQGGPLKRDHAFADGVKFSFQIEPVGK